MSYGQYQSGQTPGAPYPQQSYPPPSGGAPYPNAGYPPINPNAFGHTSNMPMFMPQPMPLPTYPPSAPSGHGTSYPPSSGGYPSNPSSYPATNQGYPPVPSAYPPAPSAYPQAASAYPPAPSAYPQAPSAYPQAPSGYPPAPSAHPPTGYPSVPLAPGASPGGSYGRGGQSSVGSSGPYTRIKRTPTVVPASPFDPRADAEILRKAMKGFGTDEKAIINVLAHRPNAQRLQIAVQFKTLYGKDLIKDLKSETTGNFENLLVAMMTPLPEYYAKQLHDAMQGLGTDENVLIEVLCTKSNQEIMVIRQAYQALYYRTLEEDLKGDTSGTFKRLMVSLCNACRDESMAVDQNSARADAQALLRAGELRLGTDESTFNMVLCQRNWAQLQLIFQEYYNLTGHDIEEAIKNEFSGNSEDGLLAVVRSIKNQPAFFAKLLNKSMKGLGTNDNDLIRLVVTRSEIDMVEIKREYQSHYGESLAEAIKGDCSGDYKKCLLHLIGEA